MLPTGRQAMAATAVATAMADPPQRCSGPLADMERLAARIVEEGPAAEGWSRKRIADALLVLSSHESFQTLVEHRGYSPARAGDLLAAMAAGLFGPTPP